MDDLVPDDLTGPTLGDVEVGRLVELRDLLQACDFDHDVHAGDALARLVAAGFLADCVPASYGGGDHSITYAARVVEEVATANPSLGWLLTIQYGLHFLLPTLTDGGGHQYFDDVIRRGGLLAGSHSRSGLAVVRDGADLVVTGVLRYCSGAPIARWITTTVSLPDGGGGTLFIRGDTPGIRCAPSADLHGMRGSLTGFVHLDNVRVPAERVHPFLDLEDPRLRPAHCRYFGGWHSLLLQNAVFLGTARGALRTAVPALRARGARRDGAELVLIDAAVGAAAAELLQARTIFYGRVRRLELAALEKTEQENAAHPGHATLLSAVANLCYSTISRLVEQAGGSTLLTRNPLDGYWRDIQLARVAEGSQRTMSRHLLGRTTIPAAPAGSAVG